MKWIKRGRELENLRKGLCKKNIYIYGAGEHGKDLFERLKLVENQIIFIDGNRRKQEEGYCNRLVISPESLSDELIEDAILIVAAFENSTAIIIKKLLLMGLEENKDFFRYRTFVDIFLPAYLYYSAKKMYFQDITILITEKCTLKCKKCAPMYPYLKNPKHRTLDEIKEDLDKLFSQVDYVWDLIFTGGEPFVHPQFCEVLKYTIDHYREKFAHIQIISNGTIIPDLDILELMNRHQYIYTYISKYVPYIENKRLKERFNECVHTFDDHKVKYEIGNSANWVDFGFAENYEKNNCKKDEMYLRRFFDDCNSSCRAFHKGHFIYCVPAYYSDIVINGTREAEVDQDNFYAPGGTEELLEWSLGFNKKGYLNMCKFCDGYITINPNLITPAEQLT